MRFKLYFELENEHFPIQYRKNILSFIKLSLTEYSEEYYKKLYNEKDNIIKPYTFAVFFRNPNFQESDILIQDKTFQINLSVADYEIGVALYNTFNHQKNKKFSLNNNSWILKNITLLNERIINTETIKIKFLSPLVVRSRENKKDYYYSYQNEEFINMLKINVKEQLQITDISQELVDTLDLKAIQGKKVIIKFYEKKMECSLGTYELTGDKKLLRYLYQAGIGSRRSSGFGMFEVIEK